MTRNEAYKVLLSIPRYDCYIDQKVIEHEGIKHLDEIDNFDYDELLEYFESLDLPCDLVLRFVTDELEGYTSLNNENYGDDYDYLELWRRENGKLDLGVWTEVLGHRYFLSDYGKTWKEYILSEEEIKAREERSAKWSKEFQELMTETAARILPKLVGDDLKTDPVVHKLSADGLADYKRNEE